MIKRHVRGESNKVKLKPLKVALQSEEARRGVIKAQVDATLQQHRVSEKPKAPPLAAVAA